MALRNDKILAELLKHPIIQEKYSEEEIPKNIREAKEADDPLIKSIAFFIEDAQKNEGYIQVYRRLSKLINQTKTK